jgi:hypothetical protein
VARGLTLAVMIADFLISFFNETVAQSYPDPVGSSWFAAGNAGGA